MQNIPIQALPNQTFSISLDNNQFDLSIKTTNGTISVTVTINGDIVIENTRAVSGMRIIPSIYEEQGNFFISTQNNEIPDYTKFGTTQMLFYVSTDELSVIRSNKPTILTSQDFDPNGALPLRFAPQGYTLG